MNTPEGKEIDYENSTIVYKPIRKSLAWEDLGSIDGCYIGPIGEVSSVREFRATPNNAITYHAREQAKASLAQAKLTQVMAAANGDWVADWTDKWQFKWCINATVEGQYRIECIEYRQHRRGVLAFKSKELAVQAMEDNAQILQDYLPLAGS